MIEEKGEVENNDSVDDEPEPDYSSLNKYFIDDSKVEKKESDNVKTVVEDVSLPTNEFSFEGSSPRFGGKEKEIETQTSGGEIEKEVSSKKDTGARKEFIKELEDDSLTLDTCSNVSRDWGKK
jgi:hypothetical protein